jgi:hypothetical protein
MEPGRKNPCEIMVKTMGEDEPEVLITELPVIGQLPG